MNRISLYNQKETEVEVLKILKSYELQTKYGIPQLSAFENSILNPTTKLNKKIEAELKTKKLMNKSKKWRLLYRHIDVIRIMKANSISNQKIANYVNEFRNKYYIYDRQYIYRFTKENNIKRGKYV